MPSVGCPSPLTWLKALLDLTTASSLAISPSFSSPDILNWFLNLWLLFLYFWTCAQAIFKAWNPPFFISSPSFALSFLLSFHGWPSFFLQGSLRCHFLWEAFFGSTCHAWVSLSPLWLWEFPVYFQSQHFYTVFPLPVHLSLSLTRSESLDSRYQVGLMHIRNTSQCWVHRKYLINSY